MTAPRVIPGVVFPNAVRIALGLLVALVGFLLTAGVFTVSEDARALIASLIALLGAVGVVPPRPADFRMSTAIALILTAIAIVLTYLTQSVIELDDTLRGIITAVLLLGASIGIVPPQSAPVRRSP